MNIEHEIRDLKRRVSKIEGSFGCLTQQNKIVHNDLLTFQAKTEQKFDQVNGRIDKVESQVRGLHADMPKIVGNALRDVLGSKTRKS
jgi:archaellum component FlaC